MPRITPAVIVFVLVSGCSAREQGADSRRFQDLLQPLDSVSLQESDSFYIGKPSDRFAVGPDGSFYIPDQLADRLLQFDRKGELVRPFGRRGRGPGEIIAAGHMTVILDSLVVHATMGRFIHAFRASDGAWLGTRQVRGFVTDAVNFGDYLLISNFDSHAKFGIAIVPKSDLVLSDSRPIGSSLVRFPDQYSKYYDLEIANMVFAAGWRDTLAVAFGGVDQVVLYSTQGAVLDTLRIPVRLRRGTPEKAYKLFLPGAATMNERLKAVSIVVGVFLLPGNRLAVTHMDADAQMSRAKAFQLLSRVYVSIVDLGRGLVCVDIPVPAFASETARFSVAGDTLYTLDQVIPDEASSPVRSVVRRYLIAPSECPWSPLPPRTRRS